MTTTGTQMAKEIAAELMALGATEEQAKRVVLKAFARLALELPGGLSPAVEERALAIASGAES
jgi:hypothetical protein